MPEREAVPPEFRAAREAWARWHAQPPTPVEARIYGRSWRWLALWDRIWDVWVERGQAAGLAEYVEGLIAFWRPLRPLLDDPAGYDPAIELEWAAGLEAAGPDGLSDWPERVRATWAAMGARTAGTADAQGIGPAAAMDGAADAAAQPAVPTAPAAEKTAGAAAAVAAAGVAVREPAQVPAAEARREGCRIRLAYGPRLDAWHAALRAEGVSASHAGNLRRYVGQAAARQGVPPEQADPDAAGVTAAERTAIRRWRIWLAQEGGRRNGRKG